MTAREVFHQQNGDVTKAYYAELAALGPQGEIAVALFRAQKRSSRAKDYRRGRYRAAAYDVKSWSMRELCRLLAAHALAHAHGRAGLSERMGWAARVLRGADYRILRCRIRVGGRCAVSSQYSGFAEHGAGMGGHSLPNEGSYDTWLTPLFIIRALGPFDLDPCAAPSPRPWPTAANHIELPADGFYSEWYGRVWLNPPYGRSISDWMEKMAAHRKGIALTFARTETETWQRWIWPFAHSILFIAGRLFFALPDGTVSKGNAGAPSALISYSQSDTMALLRSGIQGALVFPAGGAR